jgi:CRP-like cAMP-binding protein
LIDRIRHDIQEQLDRLLAEVEKLRDALAALDPRERSASKPQAAKSKPAAKRPAPKPTSAKATPATTRARARARAAGSASGSAPGTRAVPGETRTKVLAALSSDGALTAADVAKAAGLPRATVSTTLSRLAKSGAVTKADRGYRLPTANTGTPSASEE